MERVILEKRIGGLEKRIDILGKRIDTLETTIDKLAVSIARGFEEMRAMFLKQGDEIAILRKDMDAGFADVKREFGRVWERLESIDYTAEMYDLKIRVSRMERKMA